VIAFGTSQAYGWWDYQINQPMSSHSAKVSFKVSPGESPSDVADDLQAKGLIHSADAFNLYLKVSGQRSTIQAGDFVLDRNMTVPQIVATLQSGKVNQVVVRMPEGIPTKFAADTVASAGAFSAQDYLNAVNDPAWKAQYDFLGGIPGSRNPLLEGYLYPDTYYLDQGQGAHDLVKKQLDAFAKQLTPELRQTIAQKTQARQAVTVDQLVTLASMVDREANKDADKPKVCEVFYNRLAIGEPLGVDATIVYALGVLKKDLTQDDLNLNSPYNTRKHQGLPPGPIGNPSPGALKACVNPDQDDFLFYFTDKNGVTHFEKTSAEFNSDIQKYGVSGG
jgi:peptidoglycan lytic transglycosylase G